MPGRVGYVYHEIYLRHETGHHPENKERLTAILARLESDDLLQRLVAIPARPAGEKEICLVHHAAMLDRIRRLAKSGGGYLDLDTLVSAASYDAAVWAAGGTVAAVEAALTGDIDSAFALVRPPGHHATPTRSMGFCLINNVAIAAAWALATDQAHRIAIVDLDVHHGNGTQEAFAKEPAVLYISLHQYPFYPGTGHWRDTGRGQGEGSCINIPFPPCVGDVGYRQAFDTIVRPALRRFQPDLIMVSAGYDGHWADPLAAMLLSLSGYRYLADALHDLAKSLCGGHLIYVLEGGYHLDVLSRGVATTIASLLQEPYPDTFGPAPEAETPVDDLLRHIAAYHGL